MAQSLKIAVGLSGGVDSSLAARLLVEAGHRVVGLTMLVYDPSIKLPEGAKHACFGPGEEEEVARCRRLALDLGIEYRTLDLRAEYRDLVLEYFRSEYLAGRTPNPCVRCNLRLKFGLMLTRASQAGIDFDYFATGHYARVGMRFGQPCLMRGVDRRKDQSYFLYRLEPETLARLIFPLGSMEKSEVRRLASEYELEAATEAESQDFVSGDYSPLFSQAELRPGDIVDQDGRVLGQHRGIALYTIGQRRGLGVSARVPLYVSRIDKENNQVVLTEDHALYTKGLLARDAFLRPNSEDGLMARIRQNHTPAPCQAHLQSDGNLYVDFAQAQRGVAPGQSLVLYQDEYIVGGGIIA